MWPHFREGMKILHESEVSDRLTFITNGDNAEEVSQVAKLYAPIYGVSASSKASAEQIQIHCECNPGVYVVDHPHKRFPKDPIPNTRPGPCCCIKTYYGLNVLSLAYYNQRIYHCGNARTLGAQHLSIPFESDFIAHFENEPRDQEICGRCLCNANVWNSVK